MRWNRAVQDIQLSFSMKYGCTHAHKGHLLTDESSCQGVILCSAANRRDKQIIHINHSRTERQEAKTLPRASLFPPCPCPCINIPFHNPVASIFFRSERSRSKNDDARLFCGIPGLPPLTPSFPLSLSLPFPPSSLKCSAINFSSLLSNLVLSILAATP